MIYCKNNDFNFAEYLLLFRTDGNAKHKNIINIQINGFPSGYYNYNRCKMHQQQAEMGSHDIMYIPIPYQTQHSAEIEIFVDIHSKPLISRNIQSFFPKIDTFSEEAEKKEDGLWIKQEDIPKKFLRLNLPKYCMCFAAIIYCENVCCCPIYSR